MIELPTYSFCAMMNARTRPRACLRCQMTTGKLREELEFTEVIMNNKGIGAIFCLISAILTSTRYIAAAIFKNRESQAALLRVRTRTEFPEDNLRKVT